MHAIFKADDTDAVLLIDAINAFNALNRGAALHNIRVLCPVIAAYAINTYRQPARLFITGGKEIVSAEGPTQGDPLAMGSVLSTSGPDFGYFPNDKKCWIIAKPAKEENVRDVFKGTSINVTVQGQKHLGAVLGSREYLVSP